MAEEGIPRLPYAPARDPNCAFYRVDEAMFGLPPVYFYWTAPFFLLLPDGYGTARLASGVAGLIAVWLDRLGRAFYQDEATGLWAAGLYSVSRVLYLPAMNARPDMRCGTLALAHKRPAALPDRRRCASGAGRAGPSLCHCLRAAGWASWC